MAKNATPTTDGTDAVNIADLVGDDTMAEAAAFVAGNTPTTDAATEAALDADVQSANGEPVDAPVVIVESAETKAAREAYEAAMEMVATAQRALAEKQESDFLAATQDKYDAWLFNSAPTRTAHDSALAALEVAQAEVASTTAAMAVWEKSNPRRKPDPIIAPKATRTSDGQSHRGETHLYEVLFSEQQAATLATNPNGLAAVGLTLRGRTGYLRAKGDLRHARYNAGVAVRAILGAGYNKAGNVIALADEKAAQTGL